MVFLFPQWNSSAQSDRMKKLTRRVQAGDLNGSIPAGRGQVNCPAKHVALTLDSFARAM
jgi:HAMP domain-containing protein